MEGEIPLLLGLFDHADEASALGLLHACSSETGEITMEYSLPFLPSPRLLLVSGMDSWALDSPQRG